jgi:hypothetical protein
MFTSPPHATSLSTYPATAPALRRKYREFVDAAPATRYADHRGIASILLIYFKHMPVIAVTLLLRDKQTAAKIFIDIYLDDTEKFISIFLISPYFLADATEIGSFHKPPLMKIIAIAAINSLICYLLNKYFRRADQFHTR